MNKDVIYIEPENDITDILTKLKTSSQRVVALVPPKKASVLRSAVNIKLITKTARDAEKAVVLVTTDPSIIKLAAASRVPVAKNLQSRPEIPTADDLAAAAAANEQVIEEDLSNNEEEKPKEKTADKEKGNAEKKTDKTDKKDKKDNKDVPAIEKYRKWIIIGAIALVLIIGFLIWALVIAPAVKIEVSVKTTASNFSENVTFTTDQNSENINNGKFLLEQQTSESKASANFTATGQVDKGEKAAGSLTAYAYFRNAGSINVPSGSSFSYGNLTYRASSAATISWDGDETNCENKTGLVAYGCLKSVSVSVSAAEPGTQYNMGAQSSGWGSNVGDVAVSSSSAMAGGTSNIVSVVTQADVDKAKAGLESADEAAIKLQLQKSFRDDLIAIEDSFKQEVSNPVASPAVGQEVPSGTTPTVTVTTKVSMYAVDKTNVEKFIKSKTSLGSDQEVYSIGDPFFDRFTESNGSGSAKLKTTTQIGPKIGYDTILEKSKGRKIGEVQSSLKSISGVSDVNIIPSFFWVNTVPNSDDKIDINLKIEGSN